MTNSDPKFDVFWDGETQLQWYFNKERINLIQTNKEINYKQFPIGSFVLCKDGFIKKVRKGQFDKKMIPSKLILQDVQDGAKACANCKNLFPVEQFKNGLSVRSEELTAICVTCRESMNKSQNKNGNKSAERKAYVQQQRIQRIRADGCAHPGCVQNAIRDQMSGDYLLSAFEFNHKDDTKKIIKVSAYNYFTDSKAKEHNFKTWQEFWEAEADKCEVLCKGHHGMHSRQLRKQNRDRALDLKDVELCGDTKTCTQCNRKFPVEHFKNGKSVRSEELTACCVTCRASATKSECKNGTKKAERKAYVQRRRLERIRAAGCAHPGCVQNAMIDQMSDDYLLTAFEFNHVDDTKKITRVSNHTFFTDVKAKEHGFKTWQEFWEAEAKKCEVLCKGHHGLHSRQLMKNNRKRAYESI